MNGKNRHLTRSWTRLGHRHRYCWLAYIILAGLLAASLLGVWQAKPDTAPAENSITLKYKEVWWISTLRHNETLYFIDGYEESSGRQGSTTAPLSQTTWTRSPFTRLEIIHVAFATASGLSITETYYDLYTPDLP
jgi:hypothetical protein